MCIFCQETSRNHYHYGTGYTNTSAADCQYISLYETIGCCGYGNISSCGDRIVVPDHGTHGIVRYRRQYTDAHTGCSADCHSADHCDEIILVICSYCDIRFRACGIDYNIISCICLCNNLCHHYVKRTAHTGCSADCCSCCVRCDKFLRSSEDLDRTCRIDLASVHNVSQRLIIEICNNCNSCCTC